MSFLNFFGSTGSTPFYLGGLYTEEEAILKTYHDYYRVLVNGEYVGKKIMVSESESANDVENHLKSNGYTDFITEVIGNEINIKTAIEEEAHRIKRELRVYLSIS